ncbi:hypothetical protein [Burkholderia cenocepacia]|uniref:hypothetical protein n=1 Tax=Burkholderia cenocepacia TaxID=95486 RepID=UPI002230B9CB|nr:hypothetical protein [Burkholderia cenocepacia]MCW3498707.1 hypothetical protein [Burkholderia cenocepacia]MCW3506205.1 hypothetical protein [Burkholderia cenocepacia]MCW3513860.1 hypothetical protein [Burkholderia cenocepacia]MCW3529010.1 hypothetical protein [Burkholderia cenocepacia]MCW3544656.1 hypothetical protein [Burkholderia cenocepacia]
MSKYVWAWKNDDDVYTNKADSFAGIIFIVLNSFDEDVENILIAKSEGEITIQFRSFVDANNWDEIDDVDVSNEDDYTDVSCSVKATEYDVAQFLKQLASAYERGDQFSIIEI